MLRFSHTSAIEVLVGSDKTPFTAHTDFLCEVSPFFRAACNGQFRESAEGQVHLPETEPDIFDAFLVWVYTREVTSLDLVRTDWINWPDLVSMYLLAQYLQCTGFGNAVLSAPANEASRRKGSYSSTSITALITCLSAETINLAYSLTLDKSALRRLLVALRVWDTVDSYRRDPPEPAIYQKDYVEKLPFAYLCDLTIGLETRNRYAVSDPFAKSKTTATDLFEDMAFKG
jgi:hypothetical protein